MGIFTRGAVLHTSTPQTLLYSGTAYPLYSLTPGATEFRVSGLRVNPRPSGGGHFVASKAGVFVLTTIAVEVYTVQVCPRGAVVSSQRFPPLISSVSQLLCPISAEVFSWQMAGWGSWEELGSPLSKGDRWEEFRSEALGHS
jgi:hypothetical protein